MNVMLDVSSDLSLQDYLYALIICIPSILLVKHRLCIAIDAKWSDECCFLFVINDEADLMIARIGIQKRQ
jgi:hypothetical protein